MRSAVPSTVSIPIVYEVGGVTRLGAEQPPDRLADAPAEPVVQQRRRAPSSRPAARPSRDAARIASRREQVVAEQRRAVGLERGPDPLGRLAPVVDRRALAARDDPVALELGDDDGLLVRRAAGDLERLAQREHVRRGPDRHQPARRSSVICTGPVSHGVPSNVPVARRLSVTAPGATVPVTRARPALGGDVERERVAAAREHRHVHLARAWRPAG